jgi:hypothetical protein
MTTQGGQDAFQRLRASATITTLFDSHPAINGDPIRFDEGTASATITANTAATFVNMTLNSGVAGAYAVRQSYEYIPYQPGKSKLFLATGTLLTTTVANTTARVGCYDTGDNLAVQTSGNGHYFELRVDSGSNVSMHIIERRDGNVTTDINMPDWNYDAFGQGSVNPSGFTITPSDFIGNAFIFAMDQEWLAVGQVRMGFVINGQFRYVHFLTHSGLPPGVTGAIDQGTAANGTDTIEIPYTATAKLPVRWEIRATGTGAASAAQMNAICASVQSEGGYVPSGVPFSTISTVASTSAEAIIAIRLKSENRRQTLLLKSIDIAYAAGASTLGSWQLILFTPDGAPLFDTGWTDVDPGNSAAQVRTGFSVTPGDGLILDSGFISGRSSRTFEFESYLSAPRVNSSIDGYSRVLLIYNRDAPDATGDIYASMSWIEIS